MFVTKFLNSHDSKGVELLLHSVPVVVSGYAPCTVCKNLFQTMGLAKSLVLSFPALDHNLLCPKL